MKRNIIFLVVLITSPLACNKPQVVSPPIITSSSTNIPTLTPVENASSWNEIQSLLDHVRNGSEISPNGQWIIDEYYIIPATNSNKIISIHNQEQTIDLAYSLPNPTPNSYVFDSWAPDSKGLVGIYFGETTSGWDYCCGQSVAISNISNGTSNSHIFTWGWFEKPDIYWSWDGQEIGLAFRDKGFWILDRQGNLVRQILLNNISDLVWVNDNIYVITYSRNHQQDRYDWVLLKVNLNDDFTEHIYTFDDYVNPIGFDENSNQLLVTFLYPPTKLLLFDLDKNEIFKEIDLPNGIYDLRTSPLSQYTAMATEDNSLWIFDISNQSLRYYGELARNEYGEAKPLLGWYSNINGFLIRTENDDLISIKP